MEGDLLVEGEAASICSMYSIYNDMRRSFEHILYYIIILLYYYIIILIYLFIYLYIYIYTCVEGGVWEKS